MSESTSIDHTSFVTFYSFKGGVGRSMALVNVAGILAGRGFKVMALDMDLEAPGISYLMRHESNQDEALLPGFVDLLSDACERGEEADLFALTPKEVVNRYSYSYQIPDELRFSEDGYLRIMPAGQFDGDYQKRLNELNLGQLYLEGLGQPLVAAFKKVIADAACFDFVFIDSRTGFSDESGICTRDLADYLVVVMGLNRQNQEGTAEFLRSVRKSGVDPSGMRIVLSPVPNGEDDLVDLCEKQAATLLEQAWGQPLDLTLQIPYHPRLALTEEPHVFRRSRGYLYEAYSKIEQAVLALMGLDPDRVLLQVLQDVRAKRLPAVLHRLQTLARLDDGPNLVALMSLNQSDLLDLLKMPDAEPLAKFLAATIPTRSWALKELALDLSTAQNPSAEFFYHRIIANEPSDTKNLTRFANFLKDVTKDYERAEAIFTRAFETDPTDSNNLASFANFLANIRQNHGRAEALYERAIQQDPNNSNNLGDFSKLLFLQNRNEEAESLLDRAWQAVPEEDALQCELHFYACAHDWQSRPEALAALKKLLQSGSRSEDWFLDENVRAARESGHPHPDFIEALAKVVSNRAEIETLDRFEVWKNGQF